MGHYERFYVIFNFNESTNLNLISCVRVDELSNIFSNIGLSTFNISRQPKSSSNVRKIIKRWCV